MLASRRGFLGGLAALVAAPAVVKFASIMPVRTIVYGPTLAEYSGNEFLTVNEITREAIRLFEKSNLFIQDITERQELRMAPNGDMLRIRLPSDYVVHPVDVAYGKMQLRPEWGALVADAVPASLPLIPAPAVLALGAAAVLAANPTVSRRFWNTQQGSAGRDVPSSAGRPSSPSIQRTTGDR